MLFVREQMEVLYKQKTADINLLNLRINELRGERNKYIEKNLAAKRDEEEETIYQKKKKAFTDQIELLETQLQELKANERNELVEFEVFMDIMRRAEDYYVRGDNVQKQKICEIFFLNIILDHQKRLTIKVKPVFENLFVPCGGPDETRTRDLSSDSAAF